MAEVPRRLAQANDVDVLIARRRRVADFSLVRALERPLRCDSFTGAGRWRRTLRVPECARSITARSTRCCVRHSGRSSGGALRSRRQARFRSASMSISGSATSLRSPMRTCSRRKTLVSVGANASELDSGARACLYDGGDRLGAGKAAGHLHRDGSRCRSRLHRLAAGDDLRRLRRDAARPEVLAKLGARSRTRTARSAMWRSTSRPRWRATRSGVSRRTSSRRWPRRSIATT